MNEAARDKLFEDFDGRKDNGGPEKDAILTGLYERMQKKIEPPLNLKELMTDLELTMFDEIIAEVPIIEWTPMRIRTAANLARLQFRYETHFEKYILEGEGVYSADNGNLMIHPEVRLVEAMQKMINSYRKSLQFNDPAIYGGGGGEKSVGRRDKLRRLEAEALEAFEGSASPTKGQIDPIFQLINVRGDEDDGR